jgi:hypothetical protein
VEQRLALEDEAKSLVDGARGPVTADETVSASFGDSASGQADSGSDARLVLGAVDELVPEEDTDVLVALGGFAQERLERVLRDELVWLCGCRAIGRRLVRCAESLMYRDGGRAVS